MEKSTFSYLQGRKEFYNLELDWKAVALSSLMITFQKDASQVLKKGSPWLQNWKDDF